MIELLKRFFAPPKIAGKLAIASFFANFLGLAGAFYVIQVFHRYVTFGLDSTLVTLTVGALLVLVFEIAFRILRLRIAREMAEPFIKRISQRAFSVLARGKTSVGGAQGTEVKRSTMETLSSLRTIGTPANLVAITDLPFVLIFLFVLLFLHPVLALINLIFLVGLLGLGYVSMKRAEPPTKAVGQLSARSGGLVNSVIRGDTVRAFGAQDFLEEQWEKHQGVFRRVHERIEDIQGISQTVTHGAQVLMTIAIIGIGAIFVTRGELQLAALIGANILASRTVSPVVRVIFMLGPLSRSADAYGRLKRLVRLPTEAAEGLTPPSCRGQVKIMDMAFRYPQDAGPLFESLTLKAEPGDFVVIRGGNGTGKTTLARLLLGLIAPQRGQVLIDGVDLRQLAPHWWRRQIIYMPQDPDFFDGTIQQNLTNGLDGEEGEADVDVLRRADLDGYIAKSPQGLQAVILGGGATMAYGIRKRVALARALMNDGQVVVMDEPTDGLDAQGTKKVMDLLREQQAMGKTVFVFTHDVRLVQRASTVVNLNAKPVPTVRKRGAQEAEEEADD